MVRRVFSVPVSVAENQNSSRYVNQEEMSLVDNIYKIVGRAGRAGSRLASRKASQDMTAEWSRAAAASVVVKWQENQEAASGLVKFKHIQLQLQSRKPLPPLLLRPLHTGLKATDCSPEH